MDAMTEFLKSILDLPADALVWTRNADKKTFLDATHVDHRLLKQKFIAEGDLNPRISEDYFVYMQNVHGIEPFHAAKFLPYFGCLPEAAPELSDKIQNLIRLKKSMKISGKFSDPDFAFLQNHPLFAVNAGLYDRRLDRFGIQNLTTFAKTGEEGVLFHCPDKAAEIHAVIETISQLLDRGTSIDAIKVVNASDDDGEKLAIEAHRTGFVFSGGAPKKLNRFPLTAEMLKKWETEGLPSRFSVPATVSDPTDQMVWAGLVAIVNQYGSEVLASNRAIFRYEIANRSIPPFPFKRAVEILNIEEMVPDAKTWFLIMNFCDDSFPRFRKDVEYLTDAEKKQIGLRTTIEENEILRSETATLLSALPNLRLFFAEKEETQEKKPSDLALGRPLRHVIYEVEGNPESYSPGFDFALFAKRKSMKDRFGVLSNDFPLLAITHSSAWHPFDARFKGLSPKMIAEMLKKGVTISPTALQIYQECRFRFFLQYLLKLGERDESIELSFGNLTHFVLSKAFLTGRRATDLAAEYRLTDSFLSQDERTKTLTDYFVGRLQTVLDYLGQRRQNSAFTDFSAEQVYAYLHPDDPDFRILGKIDLVKTFRHEEKDYVAVIDYKTGNKTFNDEDFQKGIDIQLVFYLHLLEKAKVFSAMKTEGFYYQPINLGKIAKSDDKDPIKERLKLEGRTLKNRFVAERFDNEGNLRGIAFKKDGDFHMNVHVADETAMEGYQKRVGVLIGEAVKSIRQGAFVINPLPIKPNGKKSQSCEYCRFQGICYLADSGNEPETDDDAEGDV
jgi:hypothetical protein